MNAEAIHPGFSDTMNEYLTALEQCLPTSRETRHLLALSFAERLYGANDPSGPLPQLAAALLLAEVIKERREVGTHG